VREATEVRRGVKSGGTVMAAVRIQQPAFALRRASPGPCLCR